MVLVIFTMMSNVSATPQEPDWAAWYGGNRYDYGYDCTTDADGNVIVVGYTDTNYYDYDTLTIKYDANGNMLWSNLQ
jgi:hypothetical protein